jgi:odorant receptor
MEALVSFSDFVSFPLKCFKVYGLLPYGEQPMKEWKRNWLKVWRILGLFSITIPAVFILMFIREHSDDLLLIVENLPPVVCSLIVVVKVTCIYYKKRSFETLLDTLDDLLPKTKKEQNKIKVKEYLKFYKILERTLAVLNAIAVCNFFSAKFVNFGMSGIWYNRKLPVENWYPYDKYNKFWYNFTLLWQAMSSFWYVGGLVGSDLIFFSLITLIVMQFDILSMELEKMKPNDDRNIFKTLLEKHEKILRLSKLVQEIFSPAIFFHFITSSVLICLIGYQAILGSDTELVVKFSMFLVVTLLQILMICYYGQKLTTAAGNTREAMYNCGWSSDHKKMKTIMVLMMQRTQKPTVLTAYKFSVVNLEAFTVVSCKY